jgi:hypothetical protein
MLAISWQTPIPIVDASSVLMIAAFILIAFALLWIAIWFLYFKKERPVLSPYSKMPLRKAITLPLPTIGKVHYYMESLGEYDNRMFSIRRAAFCRETRRLFPKGVNWFGRITVDWGFLRKRYPGHYVSWGSLQEDQQREVREHHYSLEGFQTESSSPVPSPNAVEPTYAYTIPGPLYVDLHTKVLLGWKVVPFTDVEVLIVQKPYK